MSDRVRRFEELFNLASEQVLGYLVRRVEQPQDAADLMAEVFSVAWRRIDTVPAGDEGRLWLFGVARNVLANHRRGRRRHDRLADRLRGHLTDRARAAGFGTDPVAEHVRAALDRLSPDDRELLMLTAWDQLTPAETAGLLGIAPATVRSRLSRARQRLRQAMQSQRAAGDSSAHVGAQVAGGEGVSAGH